MAYEFTPEEELILAQLEIHEDSRVWPPSIEEKYKFGQTEIRGTAAILRSLAANIGVGGGGTTGIYNAPLATDPLNATRQVFRITAPSATPIRQINGRGILQASAYDGVKSAIWQTTFDFGPTGIVNKINNHHLAGGVSAAFIDVNMIPLGGGVYAIVWFAFGIAGLTAPTIKSSGLLFCPDTDLVVITP